jgi:hypothetical protein
VPANAMMEDGPQQSRKRSRSADRELTKKVRAELAEEKLTAVGKAKTSVSNKAKYKARKDSQLTTVFAGSVEARKTKKKAVKAANNRAKYAQYQASQSSFNASQYACRHCNQEGHGDVICLASCPLYCSYCRAVGHAFATCAVRSHDALHNTMRNNDAKAYKVLPFASVLWCK